MNWAGHPKPSQMYITPLQSTASSEHVKVKITMEKLILNRSEIVQYLSLLELVITK